MLVAPKQGPVIEGDGKAADDPTANGDDRLDAEHRLFSGAALGAPVQNNGGITQTPAHIAFDVTGGGFLWAAPALGLTRQV
jgi:hypothetical protein